MKTLSLAISQKHLLTLSFIVGLSIAANISIPFYPVPFTLQTMMIMLAILYDRKIAFHATALYVLLSFLGLPILANFSNGWHLFAAPSAGYVLGFVAATATVAYYQKISDFWALVLSQVIIFACGILHLSRYIGWQEALYMGGIVFIMPDIMKGFAAYWLHRWMKN